MLPETFIKWYAIKGRENEGSFRILAHLPDGKWEVINDHGTKIIVKESDMILEFNKRKATTLPREVMKDTDRIMFGIHKGKQLADVPDNYLLWLSEQPWVTGKLKAYLVENIDAIKKNANGRR